MRILKSIGFAVGLLGLLAVLLDRYGVFQDKDKIHLAALIHNSGRVAPDSPGFGNFVAKFPPPLDITKERVTGIVTGRMQTHEGFPVAIWVCYEATGRLSTPVARFEDVRRWSEETPYWWIGLTIAFAGWSVGVVLEVGSWKGRAL